MPTSKEEVDRAFRAGLKKLMCVQCSEPITDAAIDWGEAQPSDFARDGPFKVKCEHCGVVQDYDVFRRKLTRS